MKDMRKTTFLLMAALSVTPLMAETLQEIANNLPVVQRTTGQKLELPTVPGAEVRLLGADYEQIIRPDGSIAQPLTDTAVKVSFVVSKDGEEAVSRDYDVTVPGAQNPAAGANPAPQVLPALLNWVGGTGEYKLGSFVRVAADVPFAPEFAAELEEMLQCKVELVPAGEQADIRLGITNNATLGKEGYTLDITDKGITAGAPTETGLYWATRSVLQMLQKGNGSAPCGSAMDIPRYQVRSFLFDVGRLPIPMSYVKNVVKYMSWYKMNDLHIHLNDNYIFHEHYVNAGEDPFKKSYSAFRLESDTKGADGTPLTARDLFYTKRQFRELVRFARERGVNIVPEFDTPGHALSFTRVRPDLIYQGPMRHEKRRCEMLDAANPETLSFVSKVWDEYLQGKNPAFGDCPVVHVGADEFFGAAEDYRKFADGLLKHVLSREHTPRIWGSLKAKPGKTPVQSKGVQMNLWSQGWAKAWDSVHQGYDVINTNDGTLYVVPFANYYRADKNMKELYENWIPNRIGSETLPSGHPRLLGAAFAVWNDEIDRLHRGYGACDLWPTISSMVGVLSQKMWGQPTAPMSFEEHRNLTARISNIPYCNPLHQNQINFRLCPGLTPVNLGKGSRGPDYHLTMELLMPEAPVPGEEQVLLDSRTGQLLAAGKDGRITLRRNDGIEFAYNAWLPVGKRTKLELIGRMGKTELLIDGINAGEPDNLRFPLRKEGKMSTFILPLESLGSSFNGKVFSIEVK